MVPSGDELSPSEERDFPQSRERRGFASRPKQRAGDSVAGFFFGLAGAFWELGGY